MKKYIYEAKTKEEAIEKALNELKVAKENLIINTATGEVINQNHQINPFDDEVTTSLFSLFENIELSSSSNIENVELSSSVSSNIISF